MRLIYSFLAVLGLAATTLLATPTLASVELSSWGAVKNDAATQPAGKANPAALPAENEVSVNENNIVGTWKDGEGVKYVFHADKKASRIDNASGMGTVHGTWRLSRLAGDGTVDIIVYINSVFERWENAIFYDSDTPQLGANVDGANVRFDKLVNTDHQNVITVIGGKVEGDYLFTWKLYQYQIRLEDVTDHAPSEVTVEINSNHYYFFEEGSEFLGGDEPNMDLCGAELGGHPASPIHVTMPSDDAVMSEVFGFWLQDCGTERHPPEVSPH